MKTKALSLLFGLVTTLITAQNFELDWVMQVGGTSSERGLSVITDHDGNVYITGFFTGTADFDPGVGVFNLTSNGENDAFILKLDTSGNFLWVKQIGGNSDDRGEFITVDNDGGIYVLGRFKETVDFDPGTGLSNLTSNGGHDIFVEKLDASGNLLWVKYFGGTSDDLATSIVIDADGNVYITGSFQDTVDFNPGNGINNLTSNGNGDIFIEKLDSSGNFLWVKHLGGVSSDGGTEITTDTDGNVYVTGFFTGQVDFDPGNEIVSLSTGNLLSDAFIEKLDPSGNLLWVKQIGGSSGTDSGESIATDTNGNVYITGAFQGTADFDPGEDTFNLTANGSRDIFIEKLDASGNFLWAKQIGGTNADQSFSIAIDPNEDIYTIGSFQETVDFDPGSGVNNLTSNGFVDIFIQKLDASGNFLWVKQIGANGPEEAYSITTDTNGNVYTTGLFQGTLDFDPGTETNNLTSNGFFDVFVLKLAPTTLGIENNIFDQVLAYPNPSDGRFTLKLNNLDTESVKVFDTQGNQVFSQFDQNRGFFDINVQSGVYFLHLQSKNTNAVKVVKLIIK